MTEPKVGDLVAIYMKAEFSNQQEASRAYGAKLHEVLAIDKRVSVLLETEEKDIGKQVQDYSRGGGIYRTRITPVIVLRDIFELVPISQEIIGACYRGAVMARSSSPTHDR
jgi:hypothetical protein